MARFTTPRYRVREHCPEVPVCDCGTEARFEVVKPNGARLGLWCSCCAEQIAADYNANLPDVTPSQEGDEVR